MPRISKTFVTTLLCGFLVTACGGSTGGGTGAPTSGAAATFPLSTALSSLRMTGFQKTLSVSGTATSVSNGTQLLTGSLDITETAADAGSIFENQAARQVTETLTGAFNINNASNNFSGKNQNFLSANNLLLGTSSLTSYCVASTPGKYPETIIIGQAQLVVSYDCYTDKTKTPPSIGTGKVSFVVTAGSSPMTATFSTIEAFTDPSGLQISYLQKNFLVDTSGTISFISLSYLGSLGSNTAGAVNDMQLSFKAQ